MPAVSHLSVAPVSVPEDVDEARFERKAEFGRRLRLAREAKVPFLSREALAPWLGVSYRTIARWEKNEKGGCPESRMQYVADELDFDISDLMVHTSPTFSSHQREQIDVIVDLLRRIVKKLDA